MTTRASCSPGRSPSSSSATTWPSADRKESDPVTGRILAHRHRLITDDNSRWWTLGAMCFALFMVMLDNTVVNIALPAIKDSFGASISGLSWTVNAYTLVFGVLLVSGGRLGDVFGRKRMFLAGLIVFTLGSIG